MNIDKNARLTPIGRERMVRQVLSGQSLQAAARAAGVCLRAVRKWVARHRTEGVAGLQDRSSRPDKLNRPTSQQTVDKIIELAPQTSDRQTHRSHDRRIGGNRQPCVAACRIIAQQGSGAQGTRAAL